MFTQLGSIAHNTFTQSIRQPIYVVMLLLGCALLAINPLFSAYTFSDDNMLLLDLGLSTMLLCGLFLAAFTATGVLSREIDDRTVLTVISKPISRPLFLVGKYIGVVLALACAQWCWGLVFMLTLRHRVMSTARDQIDVPVIVFGFASFLFGLGFAAFLNYRRGKSFGSALTRWLMIAVSVGTVLALCFDKGWNLQSPLGDLDSQVLWAMLLLFQAIAILCAIAICVSTRLGQVANLGICGSVFILGLTSNYFFWPHVSESALARIAYTALPNLQYLWLSQALTQGVDVSMTYVASVTAYSALYITAILAVAVLLFQTREVG